MVKTQALVHPAVGQKASLEEVELDDVSGSEVLVKMVASGICHSDLNVANGAFPSPFPSIIGHEGAGIVEAVGADVKTLKPGDHVLLSFAYCGTCQQCKSHQPAYCDTWIERNFGRIRQGHETATPGCKLKTDGTQVWAGFFGQSSFSRLALVGETSCVKVEPSTDLAALAPLGCGLQTGAGAIFNRLRPIPSSSLLIIGVGAVGMGALFAAVASGVQEVIVVDIHDSRLALAESLGATRTINAMNNPDLVSAIRAATSSGQGPMYAVECTGRPASLCDAFQSMCKRGTLVSCGTPGPGHNAPIDIDGLIGQGKTWAGTVEGNSNPPEFIPRLIELYNKGQFPVDKISEKFQLEDYEAAVAAMHDGSVIKPILVF